jgi:hypothetical protein
VPLRPTAYARSADRLGAVIAALSLHTYPFELTKVIALCGEAPQVVIFDEA